MANNIHRVFDLNDLPPPPPRLIRVTRVQPTRRLTTQDFNIAITAFWASISDILTQYGYNPDLFVRQANPEQLELAMVEVRKLQAQFEMETLGELIEIARELGANFINELLVRYHMIR